MKIVCISDLHGHHRKMINPLPPGDVLICAGDCTNVGKESQLVEFIKWFRELEGYQHKIFIAGNHDFGLEKLYFPHHKDDLNFLQYSLSVLKDNNTVYLMDEEYIINHPEFSKPLKVYGSPWQPQFYDWAFNLPRNGEELETKWNQIPKDTDILITHGPPFGIRDYVRGGYTGFNSVGDELLRNRVDKIKPLLHVFGHIHFAYGVSRIDTTHYVNASICDEDYIPKNKPIIIELTEQDGEIKVKEITYG